MQVVWRKNPKNSNEGIMMESKDLTQFFNENLFIPDLKAQSKEAVFDEFSSLFVENKVIRNKEIVLEMLTKRETLGSTGIGDEVAVPHGRTTAAIKMQIAFGRSDKGIEFNAIDKKPIKLFFVVIAPPHDENNRYLPVLGKLVEMLHENKNREKLKNVNTFEEFAEILDGES